MKILFLDIDGVLNGHDWHEGAQSNTIRSGCVAALNFVLEKSRPKIVLSSAWRYMVLNGAMRLAGFEYLLRTHGTCGIAGNVIGTTVSDEHCCHCGHVHGKRERMRRRVDRLGRFHCLKCEKASSRGQQMKLWLETSPVPVTRYAAVDDLNLGIRAARIPFVQTDGATGLTMDDATKIVRLLGRGGSS